MTLFGKKNADNIDDTEDLAAGTDIDAGPPAAPPMRRSAPRKSSKGPLIVLILLLAGGGGGYYYFTNMMPPDVPPPPAHPVVAAAPAPAPAAPKPQNIDATVPPPATTTAANVPPAPAAGAEPPSAIPPAPVETTSAAEIPKDLNVTPPAAPAPAAVPAAAPAPAGGDLPVPPQAQAAATPAPAAKTADDKKAADADKKTAEKKAAPSEAERAIVENAPVLEQLSQTPAAAAKAPDIQSQPAIVRALPKEYLIVKKNHNADDAEARLTSARQALAQNRNEAALEIFEEMHKAYPRDTRVMMGRAVALQRTGQTDAALAAYEDVLNAQPKNLEALTNMLGLLKNQNPSLALSKLKELREDYPANADINAQLGISYGVSGDYASALKYLDLSDALQPGRSYVTYNRAVVYDKMGNASEAVNLYRQILQMASEGGLDQPLPLESIRSRLAVLR